MKALLVNTYDERGGAARAALRLLHGLRETGLDARLLVQRRFGRDPAVLGPERALARALARARPRLESLAVRSYPRRGRNLFSAATWPSGALRRIRGCRPDVVHLHWLGFGFLRPEDLPWIPAPIVWTLHDSWPFTGGCHLPEDCTRYRGACGACPALGSEREDDLSRRGFRRKERAYAGNAITFVAPSRWLERAARSSTLLRGADLEVIANGIDLACFKPQDSASARHALALPADLPIVLFSALDGLHDRNKAYPLLAAALDRLAANANQKRLLLAVIGVGEPAVPLSNAWEARFLGRLKEDAQVALAMAAADMVVVPSLQENQPLMAVEAMGCGRAVAAFGASGLAEIVEHERTGYLARPYEPDDLARGIAWILQDDARRAALGAAARARAERAHDVRAMAARYRSLYEAVVAGRQRVTPGGQ